MGNLETGIAEAAPRREVLARAVRLAGRLNRILERAGAPQHRRKTAALSALIGAWVIEQTEEMVRSDASRPMSPDEIARAAADWRQRLETDPDAPGNERPQGHDGKEYLDGRD